MSYVNEVKQAFTELVYDSVVVQLFKDWLIEESRKADDKAYHVGGQFNLGYAAGLDACCEKFAEYYEKTTKQYIRDEDIIAGWEDNKNE